MTRAGLALTLAFAAAPAFAQIPQPPAGSPVQPGNRLPIPGADAPAGLLPGGAPQIDPKLLAHLHGWEAVMKSAANFSAACTLVRKNLVFKKEKAYTGSIWCLKPNMARLRLEAQTVPGQKPNPNDYDAYICTGKAVYQYEGLAQKVTEFPLQNAGVGDNLLLEFMSGTLKANDIIQRFDLKLIQQDKNYVYLEITPRLLKDKAEFETMIIVLHQPNIPKNEALAYLPRTVVIRKNKGQEEEVWDFPNPVINGKGIDPSAFQYIPVPTWKFERANAPGTPPGPAAGQPGGAILPVARPKGP